MSAPNQSLSNSLNLWSRRLESSLPIGVVAQLKSLSEKPGERCGFIIDGNMVLEIANEIDTPATHFRISKDTAVGVYGIYGERITGVFHTHPSGAPYMSDDDAASAEPLWREGCPWLYYVVTGDSVTEYRWIGG